MAIAEVNADIGAQRRAEDTLLRLAAIVGSSHDAIIAKTMDGIVTDWNAAAETMFGYTAAEMIGQPIVVLFPQERIAEEAAILDRIRRGEHVETFETTRRRKDGRVIPVAVTISPILDASGAIVGASKIVRDLSERQDRERRLNELQAELVHLSRLTELGQMVSALAHEVNQPLTAMSNYLGAVRRLIAAGNQQAALQAVDRIADQGDRARQIIRRLRDQVTKREPERRVESLSKTIEEASSLALLGIAQGLKLDIRVDDDADEAVIDKVQIQQVLLNLVRNAAEAMDGSAQRELSIATARAGGMVEISVADTGPGLPESVRARLFQPFVTTKPNGMGIGLSVSRTIIEAHGGEIRAERGAGGGTVFRLTVPGRPPSALRARAPRRSRLNLPGNERRGHSTTISPTMPSQSWSAQVSRNVPARIGTRYTSTTCPGCTTTSCPAFAKTPGSRTRASARNSGAVNSCRSLPRFSKCSRYGTPCRKLRWSGTNWSSTISRLNASAFDQSTPGCACADAADSQRRNSHEKPSHVQPETVGSPTCWRMSLMICSTRWRYGRYCTPNSCTRRVLSIR